MHPLINPASVARHERRHVALLIAIYAALSVLAAATANPGFLVIGFSIGGGAAIGRYARLSEIIDDDNRRTRDLN